MPLKVALSPRSFERIIAESRAMFTELTKKEKNIHSKSYG